jgi:hypothetical protein
MKCENIQFNLSVYTDDILTTQECAAIEEHLPHCPLCRQKLSDFQTIRNDLRILPRAVMPNDLLYSLRNRVAEEIKTTGQQPKSIFTEGHLEWLQMRFMPYGVATVVTLFFGLSLLWTLFPAANGSGQNTEIARTEPFTKPTVLLARNNSSPDLNNLELSAEDYATARLSVSGDSPSLNPNGALIELTKSLLLGNMKNDEVVVVADVYGSGLAQISEVVEPSSNRRAIRELEIALNNDSADYAPFVPASLDRRSDTVRVVLKIQRVDVQTHTRKVKN